MPDEPDNNKSVTLPLLESLRGHEDNSRINTNRFHSGRRAGKTDHPVRPHLAKAIASGDPNEVFDCLTGLQKAFCEEYVKDLNGTKAAERAGYNSKNYNRLATKLLQNPGVRFAIDAIKAERAKNSDVTTDYVLKEVTTIVEKFKDANPNAALRGLELIAKHLGMLKERTEISGPDGGAIEYEQRVREDSADFISQLSSLAKRRGAEDANRKSDTGTAG